MCDFPTSVRWNVSYVPIGCRNLDVTIVILLHFSWSSAVFPPWEVIDGAMEFWVAYELGCYSPTLFKYEISLLKQYALSE